MAKKGLSTQYKKGQKHPTLKNALDTFGAVYKFPDAHADILPNNMLCLLWPCYF